MKRVGDAVNGTVRARMPRPKPRVVVTALEYRKTEATIVRARAYSGALYAALPRGGVIARFGVGHDGIDKAKASAAGLLCTNTPGVLNRSVAEHTMLLVGAASRQLLAMSARMARGTWEQ